MGILVLSILILKHGIKRDKKNTALSKHKKWLHDLQKERGRLLEALTDDEADKQQKKERYAFIAKHVALTQS